MSDYPRLRALLHGYYNQDWQDIYGSDPWEVVAMHLDLTSRAQISMLTAEIDRILARHLTEPGLRSLILDDIESGWAVEYYGLTFRGWLHELRRRAQVALDQPAPDLGAIDRLFVSRLRENWNGQNGAWILLDSFLSVQAAAGLSALRRQIDRLLSDVSEEEGLRSLIRGALGCRYEAGADGLTYRGWLTEIRRRVDTELERRQELVPPPHPAPVAAPGQKSDGSATSPANPPPRATSTWTSQSSAEATIASTKADAATQIAQWLAAGQRRTLALSHIGTTTTGQYARRSGVPQDVTGALVVIRRLWSHREGHPGYALHTAHPVPAAHAQETRLPELRQFLGGYFNQDWQHIYGPDSWAVVTRYLADSAAPEIAASTDQIDQVLALDLPEPDLAALLMDELWCYFSADADGWMYREWLTRVRHRSRALLDRTTTLKFFELGQLLGGYFGEDWATRYGPDAQTVLSAYLRGAPRSTIAALRQQVTQVLARYPGETSLKSLIWDELGCRYLPTPDERTYQGWLTTIGYAVGVNPDPVTRLGR